MEHVFSANRLPFAWLRFSLVESEKGVKATANSFSYYTGDIAMITGPFLWSQ